MSLVFLVKESKPTQRTLVILAAAIGQPSDKDGHRIGHF